MAQTLFGTAYFGTSYFAVTPNTFTYSGSGGGSAGGAATTSVLHIKAYTGSGGGTSGGAATTSVLHTKAYSGSGGGTAGGAATTSAAQIVRPVSTDSAGNWTAVPSGTISSVTSDQSDSTYANLAPADQPSTFVVTLNTLSLPIAGDGTLVIRAKVA